MNFELKWGIHFPLMAFICGNRIVVLFPIFTISLLKMKKLMMIPLLAILVITVPIAIADEDEYEDAEDDDRMGFGLMEQEREREHQDDQEIAIGSDIGNMILYGTIAAIVASVGYTGFKIYRAKRPAFSKT